MILITVNFIVFQAFGAKGFCLSPQMQPDQLASIRTFESDSKADNISESKKFNKIDKKNDGESQKKEKKKRTESECGAKNGGEICSEEPKRKKLKLDESESVLCEKPDVTQSKDKNIFKEETENGNVKDKVKPTDSDTSVDVNVDKEEKEKLKRKKHHSESSALEETPTKKRKKFKSENDAVDEEENYEEKEGM